ncbi:MAG: putative GTP-binding protein EngB [Verrucomicrobiota bacterium]|jgi:GTP-binding protein
MFQPGGFAARVTRSFPIVNISSAIFDRSAPDLASCPDESLPEFAFIGRSNVGKSSLLNLLAGQQGLARVSPMPGFTKLINMFTMNKTWRLVDLPGYGFAQVARQDKAKFNEAVAEYLQERPNLCCVFSLIDASLPPQKIDLEFVEWLVASAIPFVLVFTKIDRVKPAEVQSAIAAFQERIAEWCEQPPATFICSATEKHGRRELLEVIEAAMADFQVPAPAAPVVSRPEPEPPPTVWAPTPKAAKVKGKRTKLARAW